MSQSGGTVTIKLGGLADGATATATILVTMNPGTRGAITNTAVISGNEPTPTWPTTRPPSPPRSIRWGQHGHRSSRPTPPVQATAGDASLPTYALSATNNGPSNGTGVTITDALPTGVTYASATSSQGTVNQANGTVTVSLGNLAKAPAPRRRSWSWSLRARGTIANTAVIPGNEPDPNLANNTSTVTTQVNPLVDLAIVKSASPNPATAGEALT